MQRKSAVPRQNPQRMTLGLIAFAHIALSRFSDRKRRFPYAPETMVNRTFVATHFYPERVIFVKGYLRASDMRSDVPGISSGVDSLTAGLLAGEDDAPKALAVIVPGRAASSVWRPAHFFSKRAGHSAHFGFAPAT